MKKNNDIKLRNLLICGLLLSFVFSSLSDARLANVGKRGLDVKSIDQVLSLSDHDVDLGTAALIVSEQWSDVVHGLRYRSKLDEMALEIQNRLQEHGLRANHRAIPLINEYLFDELGFRAVAEPNNPNDLFLHSVMDNRRGYCLSLSILYLSLGERLGLPVSGVVVPGHFFVRYESPTQHFNIETTAKGISLSDEHYIKEHHVPSAYNRLYMQSLTKKQSLGCLFNNFGVVYLETGFPELAMLALDLSARINPMLSEARSNLGIVLMQEGRLEDARIQLQYALEINPNDPAVLRELGRVFLKTKKHQTAAEHLSRSLELDPNGVETAILLSESYNARKLFRLSRETLENTLCYQPNNARLHAALANVYQQNRNYPRAIQHYNEALQQDPNLVEAHFGLALCYNEQGQSDKEINAYKKVLQILPNSYAACFNLAQAYARQEMFETAQGYYEQAIQIDPRDPTTHFNLAVTYSNTNQVNLSILHFNKAIALDPKMGVAHHGIAIAYYNQGKYRDAWYHMQKAHKLGVEISLEVLSQMATQAGVPL